MQVEQPAKEKSVVLVEEGQETYRTGCSGFGSLLGGALHACLDRLISSVERRYRASKVKLDEWVIVEVESERKRIKRKPSGRLWLDIPDSDED